MKLESDDEYDSDPKDVNELDIKADFSMDDVQAIDLCDDVDESIEKYTKWKPSESYLEVGHETKSPSPMASGWQSQMQLIHFRATSEQVADEYLAQHNIQLNSGKKRTSTIRDKDSYRRGQHDNSKINVRQKTPV